MTLADAIRKGAMQREQGVGKLYDDDLHVSCALGAAAEGVFGPLEYQRKSQIPDRLRREFPDLRTPDQSVQCPECREMESLWDVVGRHLNDEHGWTREQIADWLDTLETRRASTRTARRPDGRG